MPARCLYDVLGIERSADDDAIKKAYRKQALVWHPGEGCSSRPGIPKLTEPSLSSYCTIRCTWRGEGYNLADTALQASADVRPAWGLLLLADARGEGGADVHPPRLLEQKHVEADIFCLVFHQSQGQQ